MISADNEVLHGNNGFLALQERQLDRRRANGRLSQEGYRQERDRLLGGGATTTTSITEVGVQSAVTVTGVLKWTHRNGTSYNAQGVPIDVFVREGGYDNLVATVTTDTTGSYSASVPYLPGIEIWIRARAEGPGFMVKSESSNIAYRIDSTSFLVMGDGVTVTINLTANNSADNNTAFSVHQAIRMAVEYVEQVRGSRLPDVNINYPSSTCSCYNPTTGQLSILRLDRWDWDVSHHEFGHYVQAQLGIANSPGGRHNLTDNLSDVYGKDAGTRLAWGEGWPTYFALSLQQVTNASSLGIPNVGDTNYQDTEDATITANIESQTGGISNGEDNELSVQRILWDIYDNADDTGDSGVAYGHQSVWTTIANAHPATLSAAYNAIINGRTNQEIAAIGCIMTEHRVAPAPMAPADNATVTKTSIPNFSWIENNGGSYYFRNNQFQVEFYSSTWSPILTSANLTSNGFTPTQAQWDTIMNTTGTPIYWVVKGTQTSAPQTGPYTGCYRRLSK